MDTTENYNIDSVCSRYIRKNVKGIYIRKRLWNPLMDILDALGIIIEISNDISLLYSGYNLGRTGTERRRI